MVTIAQGSTDRSAGWSHDLPDSRCLSEHALNYEYSNDYQYNLFHIPL